MRQQPAAEQSAPPRTYRPLRQIVVYLCITYGLTLAIALALPHAGITPLIAIAFPVIAVALTVAFTVPRGQRRAIWAAVGFNPRRGRGLIIGVLGPAAIIALSFGIAAAFGVVRFTGMPPGLGRAVLNITVTIVIFAVVFLGEEIGWRGYLLFRVAELTSGRRAAVITGAFHAIFHLPLLLLTTTYQNEGKRWIVVPMVMITLTLAGVWYGWLRLWSGSIWPVSLAHSAFNNLMAAAAGLVIATSPATMAYVTTETGVATMIILVLVAAYLLTRRAADFRKAEPNTPLPIIDGVPPIEPAATR
ncbi:MAG TPA: type II CAAX endopeptidase family protein [Propionibacteriaceae bacterium]|nr:type II CAAX endopeptidase family protein [Propionibacteriaceae bacterium]